MKILEPIISLEDVVRKYPHFFSALPNHLNSRLREITAEAMAYGSHSRNIYPQIRREAMDVEFMRQALSYGMQCEPKNVSENGYVYTEVQIEGIGITQHYSSGKNSLPISSHLNDSSIPSPQLNLGLYPAPLTMGTGPDNAIISYGVKFPFSMELDFVLFGRVNSKYGSWVERPIDLLEIAKELKASAKVTKPAIAKKDYLIGLKS